jgi:nitrite reductase/ring-hydroxylating ferredoxin subunit
MLKLCALDEITDGAALGIDTPDGELILVRQGRAVVAYRNVCPHLGIELNFQPDVFLDTEERYIQCSNHGALFQIDDGLCVYGPCHGESLHAQTVQVIDGFVCLTPETTGKN